jgi:hypothetical protein
MRRCDKEFVLIVLFVLLAAALFGIPMPNSFYWVGR